MIAKNPCYIDDADNVARRLKGESQQLKDAALKMARLAYAFSDPFRIQIVAILRINDSVCNCEFQSALKLSQSKASYHLKILVDAGVVEREVRGTWSHYSIINRKNIDAIWEALCR